MLAVEGKQILSEGEYATLMKGMAPGEAGTGTLQAWWGGTEIDPSTLFASLNVEARICAETDEAKTIIDRATSRMEEAFPTARFMKGRKRE